jgi:hypothetical protein
MNRPVCGFSLICVDALEDAVLHRVGVLEFVDQRHRELLADQPGQALAGLAGQRVLQAQQHVVEAHFGAAALLHFEACRDPGGGVFQHAHPGWRGLQLFAGSAWRRGWPAARPFQASAMPSGSGG